MNFLKTKKFYIILICIFISFFLIFSVIFSLLFMNRNTIISGISIGPVDVSNLTLEEARAKLEDFFSSTIKEEISIHYKDFNDILVPEEFSISLDSSILDSAFLVGRKGNIIENNYTILSTLLFGKNFSLPLSFDEEILRKKIDEISNKLPGSVIQSNYYIEGSNLIIKKGSSGIQIVQNAFYNSIVNTFTSKERTLPIPTINVFPEAIDLASIQKQIYKEAQNAYISKDPVTVHPQINGVDFAISLEEASALLSEEKDEYNIPLKITIPEKTLENLGEEAFPSLLSSYTTRFDPSNKNRSNNLSLASDKINGTIVLAGEIFSYNKVVGERTISAGYKEAAAYSGGKVVNDIGGGICQLSSTLYNAALTANLEIVSRSNHRFLTSYVPAGQDATVSWGTIDFQFKNCRSYPIKIVSSAKNGIVKIELYGIEEEKEYQVVIESNVLETIPYTTNYIEDSSLEDGNQIIEQYGNDGIKSITYKILKFNGAIISKTVLSNDSYSPLERIIRKGTKKAILDSNTIGEP